MAQWWKIWRTKKPAPVPDKVKREAAAPAVQIIAPRDGGVYDYFVTSSQMALQVATVYRCVKLLSDSVANLPVRFMRLKGGIFEDDRSSQMHYLLNVQPDKAMSAVDFWTAAVQEILLEGNAYIMPIYSAVTMDIDRLALCSRGTVMHDTLNDVYVVNDVNNGISGKYNEDEIIHLKGMTTGNNKVGMSVLAFARTTLSIAATGDNETLNRFATGGTVRGIVSNESNVRGMGVYQDEELDKLAGSIDAAFRSGENIISMPGHTEFKQISLSSADMQFLETRKFTVRDICRFFGVHPSFVFDDTSNNYKSAEMANVAFLSNTLNPLLRKIENELLRKLVSPSLAGKRQFEFDRRGLYACDLDSRVKYQTATIAAGIYTVNEWRKEENKQPVEGGDKVLVSANLRQIDELSNDIPTNENEE
ncbi:MAG: phage portal protein [Muribaculaceae bacterium]|nr:phage portal protein [Muribaculaceae bacterium]